MLYFAGEAQHQHPQAQAEAQAQQEAQQDGGVAQPAAAAAAGAAGGGGEAEVSFLQQSILARRGGAQNGLFLSHLYIKMIFYQDRLGTNIGKTQKKSGVSHSAFDVISIICFVVGSVLLQRRMAAAGAETNAAP